MASRSRPIHSQEEVRKMNHVTNKYRLDYLIPVAIGSVTLDGTSTDTVTVGDVASGDLVFLSVQANGSTPPAGYAAVATTDTITITYTAGANNSILNYVVYRT